MIINKKGNKGLIVRRFNVIDHAGAFHKDRDIVFIITPVEVLSCGKKAMYLLHDGVRQLWDPRAEIYSDFDEAAAEARIRYRGFIQGEKIRAVQDIARFMEDISAAKKKYGEPLAWMPARLGALESFDKMLKANNYPYPLRITTPELEQLFRDELRARRA